MYVYTKGMPITGIPPEITKLGQGMLFRIVPYPASSPWWPRCC
jgi:ribose transport system permease protein